MIRFQAPTFAAIINHKILFDRIFEEFANLHVAVVGDVMLDTYWWGHTDRISPEAPVPVVSINKKEYRIGGAGNVALNLRSLGARVSMHSVTGTDEDGLLLELLMKDKGINTEGIWKSTERMTTNKIRIVSRSQHLLRLDNEMSHDLTEEKEISFIEKTLGLLNKEVPQVLIFEDYNKGLLTPGVIRALIGWCKQNAVLTAVDPKRKNFFEYDGVDIFKPNLKEAKEALNLLDLPPDLPSLRSVHQQLKERLHHRVSLITLSEKGIFYEGSDEFGIVPTHIRNVADVSGAGDTVIAVAALMMAASHEVGLSAEVANLAGGLVCEEVGTVAIDGDRLLEECRRLLRPEALDGNIVDG